jgi:hypothetical protein
MYEERVEYLDFHPIETALYKNVKLDHASGNRASHWADTSIDKLETMFGVTKLKMSLEQQRINHVASLTVS